MHKTHYRGVGVLGVIIGAASMVVVYASGMIHPGAQLLPQTATVTLQDRWNNRKDGGTSQQNSQGTFDYSQFEKVYSLLSGEYFDQSKINTGAMLEGALKGMVAALNDPYTSFFDVQENTDFTQELKGQQDFEGIGAAIMKKDDAIEIQEVYKGTPAFDAGLRPLDLVVAISGEKTTEMTTEMAVSKIRGPENTDISLTILRPSETNPAKQVFTVSITRKKVSIPSVSDRIITSGTKKLGYINISIIGQDTETAMETAVKDIQSQGVDGIILDLRGNGGGFLDIGVEVAAHFIANGKTVVTSKYRVGEYDETYKAQGSGEFEKLPTVVLVDSLTASAGEIIAAALHETNGSLLIGTQTYGKGSIQTIDEFGSGTAIKYTIGKRYTPLNENVDKVGLTPDLTIPFDTGAYAKDKTDNQLDAAQKALLKLIK